MKPYSLIEQAVRDTLQTSFSDLLDNDTCVIADIDALFSALQARGGMAIGCIVDYTDGRYESRPPFNGLVWVWRIGGAFLIPYVGSPAEVDSKARVILDRLPSIFSSDRRLGGLADLVTLSQVGELEAGSINDAPFYWLYFAIEVMTKQ